ncbi:MAG: glycosyltransferase [Bacteroidales bacterium]|nr:glycosyltransferase [Bacteroidales bacterium]
MTKISIITVVFNSEKFIRRTIESIVGQDYPAVEYIIIDGKSKDSTMEIVNEYRDRIAVVISEPDKGLYDAMNKGLRLATGDYVLYINSGDALSSPTLLTDIFGNAPADSDVIYSDTHITDEDGNILHSRRHRPPEKLSWKDFKRGMLVCHQSFIARRTLCSEYDTNYRYAADYDWCLNVLLKSKVITNYGKVISLFMDGGQTKRTIVPGLKERYRIMCKHYGKVKATFWNFLLGIKFGWWMIWHRWF